MGQPEAIEASEFISEEAAAARAGVDVRLIRDWAANGLVDHLKLPRTRVIRVGESSLDALLAASMVKAGSRPANYPEAGKLLLEFLAEETEPDGRGRSVFADIYAGYLRWVAGRGAVPLTTNKVGRIMNSLGYHTSKRDNVAYKMNLNYPRQRPTAGSDRAEVAGDPPAPDG